MTEPTWGLDETMAWLQQREYPRNLQALAWLRKLKDTVEAAEAEHDDQEACIVEQQDEIAKLKNQRDRLREHIRRLYEEEDGADPVVAKQLLKETE